MSLDYLVYGEPASTPSDPDVPASHVHDAVVDTPAPMTRHSELMARVGRVLAERVDSVAQELARSGAGPEGSIQPDEALRVERHCRQVDMVITGLSLETIKPLEGGLVGGKFLPVIAANLTRGCQYRILLHGSPQAHDAAIATFRQLLAEQVSVEHVRENCTIRNSPVPAIAGIGLYLLDTEALELAEPVLFAQFSKYLTDDHRLAYITRPNDHSNADMLMGADHIRHAVTTFETLWSTGVAA